MTVKMEFDNRALVYQWFHQSEAELAILDSQLNFIDANDAFLLHTGFAIDELRQMTLFAMTSPANQGTLAHTVQDAVNSNQNSAARLTIDLIQKTGNVHPRRIELRYFHGVDGNASTFCALFRDVQRLDGDESSLREGKQRYESLKRYNLSAICSLDRNGYVTGINPAFENITGYSLSDFVGNPLVDVLFVDCAAQWSTIPILIENVETQIRHKSGVIQDVRLSSVPIIVDETLLGCYVVMNDITEQKREQQELWETKRFFKLISENAHDVISYTTPDGVCRYVSPSVLQILGYHPSEMIGQETLSFYHPDDMDYVEKINDRLKHGDDIERFTCRLRCKSGGYRWFDTSLKVVRSSNGDLLRVVGVGRDVSEQMTLQESLEQAVRIAGLGHWEWDLATNTVHTSDQMSRILGLETNAYDYGFAELIKLVHPEEKRIVDKSLKNALQSGSPFDRVFRILRQDGCVRYLHGQGEVLFDEDGIARKMVGTVHDITTLRAFERKLEESEQRYEILRLQSEKVSEDRKLAAGIAHEIRNPLTALKGFTRLLHQKSPEPNSRYFDIMQMELDRIETILSEMLVIAKTPHSVFQPVHMTTLVHEVTHLINPLAALQGVSVQSQFEDSIPPVSCDAGHLKQVLINVMKNAIEAMPRGGILSIRVQSIQHGVSIQITDNGDGISKERLHMIGEPFYTTKDNGTGLGLLVSRRLLETYGGELDIASEPGKGTTVTIHLPASPNKIA